MMQAGVKLGAMSRRQMVLCLNIERRFQVTVGQTRQLWMPRVLEAVSQGEDWLPSYSVCKLPRNGSGRVIARGILLERNSINGRVVGA